jgi:8-oxo-dGTP pyrophosphatase MutT (NUDIX family)
MTRRSGSARREAEPAARWETGGSERLYSSTWVDLDLVEVRPPGGEPYRHHVVRIRSAVGVVIRRDDGSVLLLRRHRFITDTTGYEIPAGAIEDGETVEEAARREVLEETGLHIEDLVPIFSRAVSDGVSDQRFHFAVANVSADTGTVVDAHESFERVWVDRDRLSELVRVGAVPGCLSSVAILHCLWFGYI